MTHKIDVEQLKIIETNDWGKSDTTSVKLQQIIWWLEHPFISKLDYSIDYSYNDEGGTNLNLRFGQFIITKGFEEEFLNYITTLEPKLTAALVSVELEDLNYNQLNPTTAQAQIAAYNDLVSKFKSINYDEKYYTTELETLYPEEYEVLLTFIKYLTTYKKGEFGCSTCYCCFSLSEDLEAEYVINEALNVFEDDSYYFEQCPEMNEIEQFISTLYTKATNISNSLKIIMDEW